MVLEDGEAKEIGNHETLMQKNGIYRDKFEKQQLEAAAGEKRAAFEKNLNNSTAASEGGTLA